MSLRLLRNWLAKYLHFSIDFFLIRARSASEWFSVFGEPLARAGLAVLGIVFVILAAVVVLPARTSCNSPLILASLCLANSSPRLEQRLVRSRFFFVLFHQYLDGNTGIPVKAKVMAILMMWLCVIFSSIFVFNSETCGNWIIAVMILSGFVGTWVISKLGHGKKRRTEQAARQTKYGNSILNDGRNILPGFCNLCCFGISIFRSTRTM